MKITFFNTLGAIALTGLSVSLLPTNADAHDIRRPGLRCLPHGARCVTFRGERCWSAGGRYFRCNPVGVGYVEFNAPVLTAQVVQEDVAVTRPVVVEKKVCVKRPVVVKKTVVEEEAPVVEEQPIVQKEVEEAPVVEEQAPVVEEQAPTVEEEAPVAEEEAPTTDDQGTLEEENTTVKTLPTGVKTVTIAGERCWVRGGIYYRHCARGFRVCHLRAHAVFARPVVARGPVCHAPRIAVAAHAAPFRAGHAACFHKGDRCHN